MPVLVLVETGSLIMHTIGFSYVAACANKNETSFINLKRHTRFLLCRIQYLLVLFPTSRLGTCLTSGSFLPFSCISLSSLKPGSHITVMVPAVPAVVSKAEYDYGTCVLSPVPQAEFNLVCGTAGTVQSGKRNLMSLC